MSNSKYIVKKELADLDFEFIYNFLCESYWSKGISRSRLKRAMKHSENFGIFTDTGQVGYARVITDQATFAYLCDVFVTEKERGNGCAKLLLSEVMKDEQFAGIKRFHLVTKDAHALYLGLGWTALKNDEMHMEIDRSGIYQTLIE